MEENTNQLITQEASFPSILDINQDSSVMINKLKNLELLADWVAKSETYRKFFMTSKRDVEGNVMKDENGDIIEEVSKSDIILCMAFGKEMGFGEIGALAFGKQLNVESYKKVMRGRALGLDPIASLSLISIIPTKNGDIFHTGVHVITNALNKAHIRYEFLKDYETTFIYYLLEGSAVTPTYITRKEYEDNQDRYFIVKSTSDASLLKDALANGCILLTERATKITIVKFQRNNYDDLTVSYTLQEATDAGLYKGKASDGTVVTGKDNWNSNPATMLRNRPLTIGGRIIGSDVINNTYSNEEVYVMNKGDNTNKFNSSGIEDAVTE